MDQTFQIRDFLQIFKKRIKFIITVPLLFALLAVIVNSFIIKPVYEARSDLLVNNTVPMTEETLTALDIETNLRLIETYHFIIQSDRIIDLVVEELDEPFTNNELQKKLRVETNDNSQIISLYVKENDLDTAVEIANLFATKSKEEISQLMNLENVNILTEAKVEKHKTPISPKLFFNTVISFIIGFLFACTYAFLSAYFNTKISSKEDIEKYLGLSFLGEVGIISKNRKNRLNSNKKEDLHSILTSRKGPMSTPVLEAYRSIRTNLQFQLMDKSLKTILVTSTSKNEGKTITCSNLAMMMAIDNKKTVVIDADLRKEKMGMSNGQIGLTHYLAGNRSVQDILLDTFTPNLQSITCGPIPPNPAELLSSERMDQLLQELKEHFDRIIIDSPPLFFSDAAILATKVDGCLLVVQSDTTKVTHIQQGLGQLTNVNATILGAIINKKKERKNDINYYHYGTR
ncbi:polysaccharide biosynthesis tyrosine autokinase [Pseudogracilibacillus auburnensis]|uniref:non-specific protein-tyrosine kinase n=1 Tax=Pseudogracilibacillus auburnensis TaxID=1494959 RepID=A0A2V3W8U6_9BACI|nr:polysaccharide biosynthesis tyrosine autokinase [Pseudogracilibacillus auburnensis]MBO1001498.1 polysaccharide biosynthesis tyrosine autokinase [Pseudogracilibacillus auburnensis]PXW89584.1 capsular exopolysaccharide synthesis family protein [Pseudogracilibacillus auburnensis]